MFLVSGTLDGKPLLLHGALPTAQGGRVSRIGDPKELSWEVIQALHKRTYLWTTAAIVHRAMLLRELAPGQSQLARNKFFRPQALLGSDGDNIFYSVKGGNDQWLFSGAHIACHSLCSLMVPSTYLSQAACVDLLTCQLFVLFLSDFRMMSYIMSLSTVYSCTSMPHYCLLLWLSCS